MGRALPAEAVGMPAADRPGAERLFLMAYQDYLADRPWSCLALLDQALKKNTYMVDTYLLRALAQRKLGLWAEGTRSLGDYLEVRRLDARIRGMAEAFREERGALQGLLYPRESGLYVPLQERLSPEVLPLPLWDPLIWGGVAGAGRLRSMGNRVFLPDTLGNRLFIFEEGDSPRGERLSLPQPAVVVPLSPARGWVLQADGRILEIWKNPLNDRYETKPLGDLRGGVTDGVALSARAVAVADRLGNQVRFHRRGDWKVYATWEPQGESEKLLFEPVALDLSGPFLAVADRGRGRVHVLDVFTLKERERFDLPLVRDLLWNQEGGLFLLTEDGKLLRTPPLPLRGRAPELLAEGLKDAWSLCQVRGRLLAVDQEGRRWWEGPVGPDSRVRTGFLSLGRLRVERSMGMEWLRLEAHPGSPFPYRVGEASSQVRTVWQDGLLSANLKVGLQTLSPERTLSLSPEPVRAGGQWVRASRLPALWGALEERSRNGKGFPAVLLLDSRLILTEREVSRLLGFALLRGIRVDLLCRERPASFLLDRVRRLTGGLLCMEEPVEGLPPVETPLWEISLPLPARDVPFGTPSEALLSLFGDALNYQFRDWVPLWPLLVPRNP